MYPVPEKSICTAEDFETDISSADESHPHLTYDVSVFILAYCLPTLLVLFLGVGLTLRLVEIDAVVL